MVVLPSIRLNCNLGAGLQKDSVIFNKWNETYPKNDLDFIWEIPSMSRKLGISDTDFKKT